MKCHDRISFSKLHQISSRLGDFCLNNVHHVFTYRYILDVEGFEVLVAFAFAIVVHFPQQIGDLISHHTASPCVGVDEQGPFGGTKHILERRVQVDEPPVTRHGQADQSRTTVVRPKFVTDDTTRRGIHGGWYGALREFDAHIGSQPILATAQVIEPSHVHGKLGIDVKGGIVNVADLGQGHILVVNHKIVSFPP